MTFSAIIGWPACRKFIVVAGPFFGACEKQELCDGSRAGNVREHRRGAGRDFDGARWRGSGQEDRSLTVAGLKSAGEVWKSAGAGLFKLEDRSLRARGSLIGW